MKVSANLSDVTITLGNKGITLHIADNQGKHVGDLRLGRSTGEWMKGRTREGNGVKFQMTKLIDVLNELGE